MSEDITDRLRCFGSALAREAADTIDSLRAQVTEARDIADIEREGWREEVECLRAKNTGLRNAERECQAENDSLRAQVAECRDERSKDRAERDEWRKRCYDAERERDEARRGLDYFLKCLNKHFPNLGEKIEEVRALAQQGEGAVSERRKAWIVASVSSIEEDGEPHYDNFYGVFDNEDAAWAAFNRVRNEEKPGMRIVLDWVYMNELDL